MMGKCEVFKSFHGSASDPAGGLQRPPPPPQTPSWRRAVLRTACLALQDLPSSFFSHFSSGFGRTSFFFVATALVLTCAHKNIDEGQRPFSLVESSAPNKRKVFKEGILLTCNTWPMRGRCKIWPGWGAGH